MSMNHLGNEILAWGKRKGFLAPTEIDRPNAPEVMTKLMLIVTEVAEAAEAVRDLNRDELAEELADVIIRVLHLCAALEIDIDHEVEKKMAKNENRPVHHGRKIGL